MYIKWESVEKYGVYGPQLPLIWQPENNLYQLFHQMMPYGHKNIGQ